MEQVIKLKIAYEDISIAVHKALKMDFLDNLRTRSYFVNLDSKIRGYLGEVVLIKWFKRQNIKFDKINIYKEDPNHVDIDLLYRNIEIEVKTSLIPDKWGTLDKTLQNADIKIIDRTGNINDIADIHIQLFFNFLRKERDKFLRSINKDAETLSVYDIIKLMKLEAYNVVFVAWIDKETLASYLLTQNNKKWKYGKRFFWKCPIKEVGRRPIDIIAFLKNKK